ncbi:hypothetical protein BDV18DRAFT_141843 [Aspergillus unguis]
MATETQDYTGVGGQGPAPAKFSRYRSVRKAASTNAQGMAPLNTSIPPVPTRQRASASASQNSPMWTSDSSTTIKKSMSRYRRQKPPTPNSADAPPPLPFPLPTDASPAPRTQPATSTLGENSPHRPSKDSHESNGTKQRGRFMDAMRLDTRAKGLFGGNGNTQSDAEQDEREKDRQAAMDSLTGGRTESPVSPSSRQRAATRGRAATDREVHRVANKGRQTESESRRHSHTEPKRKSFKDTMKFTRTKEKTRNGPSIDATADTNVPTLFPGIDAPVSAVNAGERRVLVHYRKHSLQLRVSPSTSASDILMSASESISEIDPPRFILMESFTASGLERPVRNYECVRDVMNSWAHDAENTLIIVPAPSVYALDFLQVQNVPTQPPMDATFHIYYSQKPRKWDKRYLTLRSDGQIVLSKKEIATKEQTNICHLSDFDIYSPTSTFLSHKVKPPKKICYAIKSQQKSSMFLTNENFIHFFATNDKSTADGWYRAVQTWRSWYLVNKLGAGQADDNDEPAQATPQVRQFKPLLATIETNNEEPDEPSERPRAQQTSQRRGSSREHGPPPTSFPRSLATEPETASNQADQSVFSSSGLLGRTYTLRQKALKEREEREKREAETLFTQGLIGSATVPRQYSASRPASRSNSMSSNHQIELDSLLKRSQSIKHSQAKPLIDLTPVYQEPPQHIRKGRGVTVDSGGPLIDSATGPSNELTSTIVTPPAKTWRRPAFPTSATSTPPPPSESPVDTGIRSRNRSNTARSATGRYRHNDTTPPSLPTSPPDLPAGALQEQAFAPNSLLARTGAGDIVLPPNAGAPIGHGVATGNRNATKPMLDVTPQSPFVEGSLLRGL